MILTCPECETQFRVADGAIPQGGREVRCASCKHQWHAYPDNQAAELPPPAEPVEEVEEETPLNVGSEPDLVAFQESLSDEEIEQRAEAIEEAVEHSLPHDVDEEGSRLDTSFEMPHMHFAEDEEEAQNGEVVIGLKPLAIAAGVLLLLLAGTLTFMVKPGLFGSPPSAGMKLADIEMRERKGRDNVRYIVEGKIVNETDAAQPVPKIRIAVMGKDGDAILSRDYVAAAGATVEAGQSIPFRADNLQTTQIDKVDYLLVDLGSGVELMKRPLAWVME